MAEIHETKEARIRIERSNQEPLTFGESEENTYIKNLEILAVLSDIVRKHPDLRFELILDRYIYTRSANPEHYPTSTETLKTLETGYDILG